MAFCNAERSKQIAEHAPLRRGLLRVLQEGKGIEGEVCGCWEMGAAGCRVQGAK